MTSASAPAAARVNPYPGIVPFDEKDAWCFFGRDTEIEDILDRLAARRLVAVIGVSGCGKSSLVRAGVIPVLRAGAAENLPGRWRIHTITPGSAPLAALRASLQTPPAWPATGFDLVSHAKQTLQPGEKLLLIVDQFEELFAFRADTQRLDAGNQASLFANLLLNAIDQRDVPIYLLLTMRSDFLGDCAQFRGLPEALNNCYYLVPRMTRAQQQEAIERPLAQQDLSIAPALVQRLLNDSAEDPDQLPILQHLLKRLWENRHGQAGSGPIDLTDYDSVGGWQNALDNDANQVLAKFPHDEIKIARLFKWITAPGTNGKSIRRPRPYYECVLACNLDPDRAGDIVAAFEERGLLRWTDLVDIPHESMIRQWSRLRSWVAEEAGSASVYLDLVDAVRRKRSLYRGADLLEAVQWQKKQKPNELWASRYADPSAFKPSVAFLRRSQLRQRLAMAGLALAVLAVAAAAVTFYVLKDDAESQQAIAESRQLAAAAQISRNTQADLALLLGVQSYRTAPTLEARSIILSNLQNNSGVLAYLPHSAAVYSVAFSPDGKTLASASEDSRLQLWDVATRRPLGKPLTGHTGAVYSVAFSPDGKTLASAGQDLTVRLWDVATRRPLGEPLTGHIAQVSRAVFSPDSKTLASASQDKTVRLWDVATRRALGEPLTGHTGSVLGVAFSPDGKTLASASADQTVRLWDVATRRPLGEPLIGHTNAALSVAFSPDGKTLASASEDKTIRLWDVARRRALDNPLSGHTDSVESVAFSPDGKTLASAGADNTIRLWDVATHGALGEPLTGHTDLVYSVAFSPSGKTLASASWDKTARLWDVAMRPALGEPLTGHSASVRSVAFSPDGRTLVSAGDHTLRLWDMAARRASGEPMIGHRDSVFGVAFSPDGKTLASGGQDHTLRLWDVVTRSASGEPLIGHRDSVYSVAFSPDGKTLASGSQDKTIRLWDVATRSALGEPLTGHTDGVFNVVFSPNGKTLASGSFDHTIRLWDVATHHTLGEPLTGHTSAVSTVAFSPDGKTLASGAFDNTIRLWDVATHDTLGEPLTGHTDAVYSVTFSPDRKSLASGSKDKTIRLWDVATHRALGEPLTGHTSVVRSVAFNPDGNTLASASWDQTVRLWDVDINSWISRTCSIANRNLTLSEWRQYIGPDIPYQKTCPNLPPGTGAQ